MFLNYIPEQRSQKIAVFEEAMPIFDLAVSIRTSETPTAVVAVPQGEPLSFAMNGGRAEFSIHKVQGHQMVSIEYASSPAS